MPGVLGDGTSPTWNLLGVTRDVKVSTPLAKLAGAVEAYSTAYVCQV